MKSIAATETGIGQRRTTFGTENTHTHNFNNWSQKTEFEKRNKLI